MTSAFAGFPEAGLAFLTGLAEHNERTWFETHRADHERHVLEPARALVEAIGVELAGVDPEANADPRVGGSIMRIHRDTRFARDKRPYKIHLDLWFWRGAAEARHGPGYFFRLTPASLTLGAGMHRFERDTLERYRAAVADPGLGERLADVVAEVQASGYDVGGRTYKRPPRDFEVPSEREPLLLHSGLYAGIDLLLPPEVHTARLPRLCVEHFARLAGIPLWLSDALRRSASAPTGGG